MIVEQIYTGCLAQGAYYIRSGKEAVIIDPLREVEPYLQRAERDGVKIKYILETHFHADFVSGHVSLAKRTGATIVFGPTAKTNYSAKIAEDGELLAVGEVSIKVLHTPGHTMESTCYLLLDKEGKPHSIFTGDTLFLGDVGRPDLAQKAVSMTQEELAGILYESLRNKIMPLADDLVVYPGHGAGSACGKNMMKETVDTLGNQKKVNYALRADMSKEDFIKEVTDGLAAPPGYFPKNVQLNKDGYTDISEILSSGTKALSPEEFESLANLSEALILDVRDKTSFSESHIPGSIFIGLGGSFAPWVGELVVDIKQSILLVVPENKQEEAVTRLSRVGFDNTLGFLSGGIKAWQASGRETDNVRGVDEMALASIYEKKEHKIFDLRKDSEYSAEHFEGVSSAPLNRLNDYLSEFPKEKPFYIHCASGYRSVIAASILKSRGYHNVVDVLGGFKALKNTKMPTTEFVCPSTQKLNN